MPPMPPFTCPLQRVRDTCALALARSPALVSIDPAALAAFARGPLASLASDPELAAEGVNFPLRLSPDEDMDLTTVFALLQLGSGYRAELHAACGAGASDTLLRGLLCFALGGRRPTAGVLQHLRAAEVADIWGIPRDVDEPVGPHLPGVTISRPGPLAPLVERITGALNGAGAALAAAGAGSFAELYRARAGEWAVDGVPRVARFVAFLVAALPAGFRDVADVPADAGHAADAAPPPSTEVWLLKKAQLCARELGRKFGASEPRLFGWPAQDGGALTVFADNVLPAVLRAEGVLRLGEGLAARIDAGEAVTGAEGALLRAAAVVAGGAIVRAMAEGGGEPMSEARLDSLLWRAGKVPKYRALKRHAEKDTSMY